MEVVVVELEGGRILGDDSLHGVIKAAFGSGFHLNRDLSLSVVNPIELLHNRFGDLGCLSSPAFCFKRDSAYVARRCRRAGRSNGIPSALIGCRGIAQTSDSRGSVAIERCRAGLLCALRSFSVSLAGRGISAND